MAHRIEEWRSEAVGILYAEEFGLAPPAPPPAAAPPPVPPPPPLDVDAMCDRAVAAARLGWAQSDDARRTAALETLAAGFSEARAEAARQAEALAEAIARTALSMVAGLLPEMLRRHGPAEVRALVGTLAPRLARATPVTVRLHPSLVEAVRADLDTLGEMAGEALHPIDLRPANIAPGDARLAWPDGTLVRDTAAIQAAITTGLAQLGLLETGTDANAE